MAAGFTLDHYFLPVFDKVDFAAAYPNSYDYGLVATSLAIAVLAALVALSTSGRIAAAATPRARWAWTAAGALSMGGGIWAMHFLGMLAFSLPCGISYQPLGTVLSMIPGMIASGIALATISKSEEPNFRQLMLSAVFMGAGIGAMHYSGMAAMLPEALLLYDPGLVAVSVVVAIVLAFLSLSIRYRSHDLHLRGNVATFVAATVMGCAVAGMHYTAMQASFFFPLPNAPSVISPLSTSLLAIAIAIFTILIAALTLVATFAGRQNELALNLTAEIARREGTERDLVRAREQAEAANRAKSTFVATVSHEIRTPMNGVLGMAHLLGTTALNERQRRLVDNLLRSGKALVATINDILDFSKIEAGRVELFETEFDPREVVAEVTDLFCEPCAAKDLEFVYFVAEDVPRRVTADAVKIRQVLINLVGNALKFTERGEIVVEVTCGLDAEQHFRLEFVVADTGIGIASEDLGLVFDSFYQAEEPRKRVRGGSGLGLTIARSLVERMGGRIDAQSTLQEGSRFHFTVPVRAASVHTPASIRQIDENFRVLLVDANAASRRVLSTYFASWRIGSVLCATIPEAETAWNKAGADRPFNAVVIDIKGLGEPAVMFARMVAAPEQALRSEVIALMGIDALISDEALEGINLAAALTKPARPSELFNALTAIALKGRGEAVPSVALGSAHARGARFDAKILVVEDNPVNQEVAVGMLEALGCHAEIASDGSRAVAAFANGTFDLVLMDCEMPVMDGFTAAEQIRAVEAQRDVGDPNKRRTPIVAVTAHALVAVYEKCIVAGMDDFLIKPYSDTQLVAALRRWVRGHERGAAPAKSGQHKAGVIDHAVIEQLRSLERAGSGSLLKRVVSQFAISAPPLVDTILTKVEEGDGDAIWRAAHSLKSSAAAVGARQLSQCCAAIEHAAREDGAGSIRPLVSDLRAELRAATESLDALLVERI